MNPATRRYYDNSVRPPDRTTGRQATGKALFGWAKDHDCLPWFTAFGRAQNPPLPKLVSDYPRRLGHHTRSPMPGCLHGRLERQRHALTRHPGWSRMCNERGPVRVETTDEARF